MSPTSIAVLSRPDTAVEAIDQVGVLFHLMVGAVRDTRAELTAVTDLTRPPSWDAFDTCPQIETTESP